MGASKDAPIFISMPRKSTTRSAADLAIAFNSGQIRFYRDEWWRFDGGVYRQMDKIVLKREVHDWLTLQPNATPSQADAVISILKLEPYVYVPAHWDMPALLLNKTHCDERDKQVVPTQLINLKNGLFDLDAWEQGKPPLSKHSGDYFSVDRAGFDWDSDAKAPIFKRFLKTACADAEQQMLALELLAWFCTWDVSLKKVVFLYGESDTGKSVFSQIAADLVGEEIVSNLRLEAFAEKFEVGEIRGKKLNITPEARFAGAAIEEKVKSISGGDRMTCDVKNKKPVTFKPTAKLMMAGNTPARFSDTSNAIWNRLIVLHFNNIVDRNEQDRELTNKLRAELPGIFRLAMLAWREMRRRGDLTPSKVSSRLVNEFRLCSNAPAMFFVEEIEEALGEFMLRSEVFDGFGRFCALWGYTGKHNRDTVFAELRRRFPNATEGQRDGKRGWWGLRFVRTQAQYQKYDHLKELGESQFEAECKRLETVVAESITKVSTLQDAVDKGIATKRRGAIRGALALTDSKELKKQVRQKLSKPTLAKHEDEVLSRNPEDEDEAVEHILDQLGGDDAVDG